MNVEEDENDKRDNEFALILANPTLCAFPEISLIIC